MAERLDEAMRLLDSWHDNAAAWTAAVRSGAIESRRLATDAAILGAVQGRRPQKVLDLGCGEGWLVRALAEQGITALGVDGSAPLIEAAARAGGSFLRLSYAELIAAPERCGAGFDLVVANFALFEEKILPLLKTLRRIMTADGWLLVQTLHPLAVGPPYQDGWRTEDFCGFGAGTWGDGAWTPMPWYFRTLGSWVGVLREAGFALHGLREPAHPQERRPLSLLLEAHIMTEKEDLPCR
jgi:2-polyprenyl-3-methyl-5-hydroxy-6-metoxy-1,4-benzoquinol methylase